jgi:hypothetical protein
MRVMLEIGPRGKKVVALAPHWPGLERGAKNAEDAIEVLLSYLPRYARIAHLAGMDAEFTANRDASVEIVEQYPGNGSTDFWGISFAFSDIDKQELSSAELERELGLMRACWAFFDEVRGRVSIDLQKGPRGGGRDRDGIARHVIGNEQYWAKKLGASEPHDPEPPEEELRARREAYCDGIRTFHAEGKKAGNWPLRYLIRHTAYHTLDHTWEMEDRDLTAKSASVR